jgi:hypothetical protein
MGRASLGMERAFLCQGTNSQIELVERDLLKVRFAPDSDLSRLKNPSGHGIGLPMKAMIDDFGYSNRALLSRDPVSLYGF